MTRVFENRQVIITGGIGGLGAAVVGAFVDAGATVHIPNFFDNIPDTFLYNGNPNVHIINEIDLTDEATVEGYYDSIPEVWAAINLAGGFEMSPIADTSLAEFMKMINRNAVTCFLGCREAVRAMRRRGDGLGGRIVNVTARPAVSPVGGMVGYATSKAAVAAITQSLAEELKGEGIYVNAIMPSVIDTAANRRAMPDADFDSWPKPEQIARTLLFLASPANEVTSGALIPVFGLA